MDFARIGLMHDHSHDGSKRTNTANGRLICWRLGLFHNDAPTRMFGASGGVSFTDTAKYGLRRRNIRVLDPQIAGARPRNGSELIFQSHRNTVQMRACPAVRRIAIRIESTRIRISTIMAVGRYGAAARS